MWRLWGGRVKNCQWVTSLEIVPVFFHWYSQNSWCQELQGMRVYHFRPGSSGLFSWKQQTGVWLTVANVLPNLAVFAREVLILIFFSQRNSKRKFLISAVKVLIRSGHNLNQTRDIPLVSVTICQMWQITPIFRNQEKPSNDSFRTRWYCFCGIARSPLYPQTPRPLKTWRFA